MKLTFRGLARIKQHQPKRAQAMTPEMLNRMYEFIDKSNASDPVIWADILVAFFCLLRKFNFVPESQKSFDNTKQLCREDIELGTDYLLVHVRAWISYYIPWKTIDVITYPCPNISETTLVKRPMGSDSVHIFSFSYKAEWLNHGSHSIIVLVAHIS